MRESWERWEGKEEDDVGKPKKLESHARAIVTVSAPIARIAYSPQRVEKWPGPRMSGRLVSYLLRDYSLSEPRRDPIKCAGIFITARIR